MGIKKVRNMARTSREKDQYGIYYLRQRGAEKSSLFRNAVDREMFLKLLLEKKEEVGFKIYAYCIRKRDEYHIILDANGSDISKVMKSLNISYALYRKSKHSLFRDRYYSELLPDNASIKKIFEEIHKERDSEGFNSYCYYSKERIQESSLIDMEDLHTILLSDGNFKRDASCHGCIETFEEAEQELLQEIGRQGLTPKEFYKKKQLRNQKIWEYRRKTTLSLKELGRLFGGLSESSICKVLKNR